MKKLILFELTLLFLATTFVTDSPPPGWYQQTIPTNKPITDIFFIDSLRGWATISSGQVYDSAKIIATTDGGNNWFTQYGNDTLVLNAIQFLDINMGYAAGGNGPAAVFKTTNGGSNWNNIGSVLGYGTLEDLFFVNKDTGWVCDGNTLGGMAKTINGGVSWQQQLNQSYLPKKLFFINKDTGWAVCNNTVLYRTTNGGVNWNPQYTFPQQLGDVYFFNRMIGIVSSGFNFITIDGGFNWTQTNSGGSKLSFADDSVGWAGNNFNEIQKTTNGGNVWFSQISPIFDNESPFGIDSLKAWAGGTGLVHTTDGGGPPAGVIQGGNEIPLQLNLYQNYPNPFNPVTNIKYQIVKSSYVILKIYDVRGKEIKTLVEQKQNAGTYEVDFDGSGLASGVYLYQLTITNEQLAIIFRETRKMILVK